jgi:predicted Zn finger-like uncharacterized protein
VIIACPHCKARHRVEPGGIPSQGAVARCAKCGRAFGVGGNRPAAEPPVPAAGSVPVRHTAPRAPAPGPARRDTARPQRRIPPRGAASRLSVPPPPGARSAPPRATEAGERIRLEPTAAGERPLLVTHGFGLGDHAPASGEDGTPGAPADAFVAMSAADLEQIAADIVHALVAAHPDLVAKARADQRWDAHLGPVIRDAWSDFQACAGAQAHDEVFRAALNAILAGRGGVF